jgi:hypothetical protein
LQDEKTAQDEAKKASESAAQSMRSLISDQIKSLTETFRLQIGLIDDSIRKSATAAGEWLSLSKLLTVAADDIRGVGADDARARLGTAIRSASQGNVVDLDALRPALNALNQVGADGFSTREELARVRGQDAGLIDSLSRAAQDQLSIEEQTLEMLELQKEQLTEYNDASISALSRLIEESTAGTDAINSVNASINILLGNKSPLVQSFSSMASSITSLLRQQSEGIPRFASGGMHSGGLRIVGERGPELELTGPSRIISNEHLSSLANGGNKDVSVTVNLGKLEQLIEKLSTLTEQVSINTRSAADTLTRVSQDGTSIRTTA